MKKVVLNAGHGGKDSGAVGNGLKEKDRALDYTLAVGKELSRHGVKVEYTRTTDVFIELHDIAKHANSTNADLFISFHLNSFSNTSAKGFEIYHYPNSSKGSKLARDIHSEVVSNKLYTIDRGVKIANFSVLKNTKMPSTLIELGFISNKEDVNLLLRKQAAMVQAITKGILKNLGIKYQSTTSKPVVEEIEPSRKVKLKINSEIVEVDGFLIDGTNYVPIRTVEKLGHKVSWDNENRIVVIE